jgi:hypothetical protein
MVEAQNFAKGRPPDIKTEEPTIEELIRTARELSVQIAELDRRQEFVKNKIRIFLKERAIRDYVDKDGTTARLDIMRRESVDIIRLKATISEKMWSQVVRITTFEKLSIVTKEVRDKMKKFAKSASVRI